MLQAGQDLPFAQEAFARGGRIGAGSDQFQCRLLGVGTVAALDRVYRAHATAADHLAHAPGTDAASEHRVGCAIRRLRLQCLAPGRDVAHVPSSASRNARARRQSRRRVRSLMPSIAAISVSE